MSASATQGGHKEERNHGKNIMACPIPHGGHNNVLLSCYNYYIQESLGDVDVINSLR